MGSPGLGLLPQREVERGALLGVDLHPGSGPQGLERLASQQPVAFDLLHVEVDAARRLIGDAPTHQIGHQRHHVVDVRGGVRRVVGTQHPEGVHRLPPPVLELPGHLGLGATLPGGAADDLVVDVGHVRDVVHVEPAENEVATQDVEDEREAAVPDMGDVVDGQAADVHRRRGPDRAAPAVARVPVAVSWRRSTQVR